MADVDDISGILAELEEAAGIVATHNAKAISQLYVQLRDAARTAGVTNTELGRRLGTDPSEVQRILLGQVDITLADLELILAAVDARLHAEVTSAKVSAEARVGPPAWRESPSSGEGHPWTSTPAAQLVPV